MERQLRIRQLATLEPRPVEPRQQPLPQSESPAPVGKRLAPAGLSKPTGPPAGLEETEQIMAEHRAATETPVSGRQAVPPAIPMPPPIPTHIPTRPRSKARGPAAKKMPRIPKRGKTPTTLPSWIQVSQRASAKAAGGALRNPPPVPPPAGRRPPPPKPVAKKRARRAKDPHLAHREQMDKIKAYVRTHLRREPGESKHDFAVRIGEFWHQSPKDLAPTAVRHAKNPLHVLHHGNWMPLISDDQHTWKTRGEKADTLGRKHPTARAYMEHFRKVRRGWLAAAGIPSKVRKKGRETTAPAFNKYGPKELASKNYLNATPYFGDL